MRGMPDWIVRARRVGDLRRAELLLRRARGRARGARHDQGDGLGPLDLRRRRQPGSRARDGHSCQGRARLDLRHLGLLRGHRRGRSRRPHRREFAALRQSARTGHHSRRHHRRRELSRRARPYRPRAHRRGDDRRHPQRAQPAQRRRLLPDDRHRPHHRRGGRGRRAAQPPGGAGASRFRRRGPNEPGRDRSRSRGAPRARSASARCMRSRTSASRPIAAKCSPCSATTAPASRRWSNASAASTRSTTARSFSTARPLPIHSPAAARRAGIETVYQDLALFDNLTPAQNFYCGREIAFPAWLPRGLRFLERSRDGSRGGRGARATEGQAAEIRRAGRAHVGRSAPGHRGRARDGVRAQGRDPRRADRRAWRARVPQGARPDRAAARGRQRRHPHHPQHGARRRARRPRDRAAPGAQGRGAEAGPCEPDRNSSP